MYVAVSQVTQKTVISIYSDKLAHVEVVINCRYSVAQICTHEDMLAYILGAPSIDDIMSHNLLTTYVMNNKGHKMMPLT